MNTFDKVMQKYLEIMSKAPKECQTCKRRHFFGCDGCENSKYWENRRNGEKYKIEGDSVTEVGLIHETSI